jgi:phosphoribosylglycinamide formyltransferase 1
LSKKSIVIFGSGHGRNAANIIRHFSNSSVADVVSVLANNSEAGIIQKAKQFGVPVKIFNRKDLYDTDSVLDFLSEKNPALIILAGFLWMVPEKIIRAFPEKIINIHPALLPKFGGKGMFGNNVQKKVLESGAEESGITIHYVNEQYDDGDIIFQAKCPLDSGETVESLTKKVHALEDKYFPHVIESLLLNKKVESLRSG